MSINTISCTPGQLPSLLKYLYKLKLAAFLWGEPGVGKSMCVKEFTEEEGMLLEDVRLTQMDAPDLRGLQWVDEVQGITKSFRPEFFPIKDVKGCVFLDELTAAEPRMQATAYQLVLDRRIGPHILPPNWMVLGAGNCPEDGAISYKMGSALSDRFVHVLVVANSQDWLVWAVKNDIHPAVLSFIRVKPDYLTTVQGQSKGAKLICPSPRSWHRVSQVMQTVDDNTCNSILINGIVGDAAAVEFRHTVEEISELPEMSYLLELPPNKAVKIIPLKISCLYGLAYSMTAYATKPKQFDGAMAIFDALRKVKTNEPVAEIETLANELLLDKAIRLGVHGEVVRMPAYQNYVPRAQQIAR